MKFLNTTQAAKILGISRDGVLKLIYSGTLRAEKVGRDWMITPAAIEAAKGRRVGRPSTRK